MLAAEKSQLIAPASVKKLAAVKNDLVAAAATTMDKASDNEHGTLFFRKRTIALLVDARKQFAYLSKILDLERAEL